MRLLLCLISLALLVAARPAFASGDVGCEPKLQALHTDFSGCDNVAFIGPGNDTRANLTLLLADRAGTDIHSDANLPQSVTGNFPAKDWAWPVDWNGFHNLFIKAADPDSTDTSNDATTTDGEGTVCVSQSSGADSFIKAVAAETALDDAEKQQLTDARKGVSCSDNPQGGAALPALNLHSPAALEFGAYLAAAAKFYGGERNDASAFTALKTANQSWVKEAAIYMEARVKLLAALNSALSKYGDVDLKQSNKDLANAAGEALKAYLKDYPKGAYADSARGLLRRAYWLAGDTEAQLQAYATQMAGGDGAIPGLEVSDLAEEVDNKLPVEAYTNPQAGPLLVAIDVLRNMRPVSAEDAKDPDKAQISAEKLMGLKDHFKDTPELFTYLQAAQAWFVQHDAKQVLALLPDQKLPAKLNNLQFSIAMLRASALNDMAAFAPIIAASASPFQKANAEMGYAMAAERAGKFDAIYGNDSPVDLPLIRVQVVENAAGPGLLRRESLNARRERFEREQALFTLLYRDVTQGAFKAFVDDVKLVPPSVAKAKPDEDTGVIGNRAPLKDFLWDGKGEDYQCPGLAEIGRKLAAAPKDANMKLCLGEFIRLNLDGLYQIGTPAAADELGGAGLKFPGKTIIRHDIYTSVIADPAASADNKAFALYRAIECYASVGDNHCGGKGVDKATRKAWFNRLHGEFGNTKWAGEAKYYY